MAAFLNAGAKCVLASLWPVSDFACMLTWTGSFAWREETKSIAASLQTAQQWLRSLTAGELLDYTQRLESRGILKTYVSKPRACAEKLLGEHGAEHRPFESPFFWAPFVAVGQGYPDPKASA